MTKLWGIIIADDHALMREGLRNLVESEPEFKVVGESANGADAISLVQQNEADLLLVDLSMPGVNGIKVTESVRHLKPHVKIIAITAYNSSSYIYSALKAGVHGYLVKTEDGEEILKAIRCVLDGQFYLSPEVTGEVIKGYLKGTPQSKQNQILSCLTNREKEIVEKMLRGHLSNKKLAAKLFVSEKTIQKHKTNIFRKLDIANSNELIHLLTSNVHGRI